MRYLLLGAVLLLVSVLWPILWGTYQLLSSWRGTALAFLIVAGFIALQVWKCVKLFA